MKRVLMLAYFFPPSKAAGSFRTLRFVRDLPALGWTPSVLTARPGSYPASEVDPALVHKIPTATRVHRTPAPPYHRWFKRAVEAGKALSPGRNRSDAAADAGTPADPASSVRSPEPANPAHSLEPAGPVRSLESANFVPTLTSASPFRSPLALAYMLCRTPDIDAGWYVPALARGLELVTRERPRVIYATGGPWTTFLVARDLARLARLPLVLDYRDPWTRNPSAVRSGNAFEGLALRLERTVIHRATWIVANTDVLRSTLIEAHGEAVGRRTVVIHNSYDAADYAGPEPEREEIFTLSYIGAMYDAHSPEPFLGAVASLAADRPDLRRRFRVRLVGAGAGRVAVRVRSLGIEDIVQVQEPVPHAEAVRLQRAAHALLLFLTVPSENSTFVPGKLYEYVAANRPILAVTRGGALAGLLRRRQLTPWIYRPEDSLGIAQGILNLLERHERGCLPALPESTVRSFSGEAAARALAGVLEASSAGGQPPTFDSGPSAEPERVLVEVEAR